jgi:hypothetical protein
MTDLEAKLIEALRAAIADEPNWRVAAASLTSPDGSWACHVEIGVGEEPDSCVIDEGDPAGCVYAREHKVKEKCPWWAPKTAENLLRCRRGDEPIR